MKLAKFAAPDGRAGIAWNPGQQPGEPWYALERPQFASLQDALEVPHLLDELRSWAPENARTAVDVSWLQAPVDRQEVWAAGVTYRRSQAARMEESEAAASCYDRVYAADRPELFLKATPHRVVGPGGDVRIREDAVWNVPEPELTLVLNSRLEMVGYTIGNDMSSRDIEGENPLYLPQAKVYRQCCAVGPAVTLAGSVPDVMNLAIRLRVTRNNNQVFDGTTSTAELARTPSELVAWLQRDNEFPDGVLLLTGTGIVPPRDFSLVPGDCVRIEIDHLGRLENMVVQGETGTG